MVVVVVVVQSYINSCYFLTVTHVVAGCSNQTCTSVCVCFSHGPDSQNISPFIIRLS